MKADYENKVPGPGNAFIVEVQKRVELLGERPEIGQGIDMEFHYVLLAGFP